ncbi:endonuclease MutS2 [Vaginisenegalia massiliensis]|uniref:endonuclease MutS2 n=1 Tax=Vaginisenegalia massiliensis TaxID=2058294 RepID=UPI000F5436E3|nr:endonuclease MutS2 [Vaginisenegalia massiliensis]
MNKKIFATLEFDKIRQALAHHSQTDLGEQKLMTASPSQDLTILLTWQDETEQAFQILQQSKQMPIPRLTNLTEALKRLELGASLNGRELSQMGKLLKTVKQMVQFFQGLAKEDKHYPALKSWVDQLIVLTDLIAAIELAINEDGTVLSTASTQLAAIRRSQSQTEQAIRQLLNDILKNKSGQLSDALITVRNNRYVLPVKAEYRMQFGGMVHDQSSTGQTLYIEPQAAVTLNNKRSQLQADEQKEIERILEELSSELRPYWQDINANQGIIAQLDYIQARALYAQEIDATRPIFSEHNDVALWQARHPLIDSQRIVANDIIIGQDYRALIITGPNTGGKTILLKTLSIIQLMAQMGLHIPCQTGSQVAIFDQIFADIGDEQSIEQNLSTFSSHMTNIVQIVEEATSQSLILFDELGSGTDPQEGAALAMAILNYLRQRDIMVMATTHYPELKVYAHETPQTINASMEFDSQTLSPTYRLLIGVPGRSNAFEISQRLGLNPTILADARRGISPDSQSINEMVAKLEKERRLAELSHQEALEQLEQAEQLHQDLRTEYDRWLEQKHNLVEKAKQEANEKVQAAQEKAEKIIQEIRDLQLEQGQKAVIKEHVLIDKKQAFQHLKEETSLKKNKVLKKAKAAQNFVVGQDVEVLSYGQRGTIIEQSSANEFIVQMGILKMKIDREDLAPLKAIQQKRKVNVQRQATSKVQSTLDIRGQRYEEALYQLNQYLDTALLSHHAIVTIIHGKGTGALRQGVKEALKKHPQVDHFEYSPPNAGGDGSTVVYFK